MIHRMLRIIVCTFVFIRNENTRINYRQSLQEDRQPFFPPGLVDGPPFSPSLSFSRFPAHKLAVDNRGRRVISLVNEISTSSPSLSAQQPDRFFLVKRQMDDPL